MMNRPVALLTEGGGPLFVHKQRVISSCAMAERLHHRLYCELPVCPECHRVGKVPQHGMGRSRMTMFCTGPLEDRHSKQKMSVRLFVESRAKVKADA